MSHALEMIEKYFNELLFGSRLIGCRDISSPQPKTLHLEEFIRSFYFSPNSFRLFRIMIHSYILFATFSPE